MEILLREATNQWMSNACQIQYQCLLLDKDRLTFNKSLAINPATLLPDDNTEELMIHDCMEMLDINQGTQLGLTDIPVTTRDVDFYTDGNNFIQERTKYDRAMVVTVQKETFGHKPYPRAYLPKEQK